jgi:hypothetical protein
MTQLAGGATASMVGTQSTYFAELPQHPIKNAVFSGFIKVVAIGMATAQLRSHKPAFVSRWTARVQWFDRWRWDAGQQPFGPGSSAFI